MKTHEEVRICLKSHANSAKAAILSRFFKTGKGDCGEGDRFIGVTVPLIRHVVKQFHDLSLPETEQLLHSTIHEERLTALLILVHQFQKGDRSLKEKIYRLYVANTRYINNWDLVDLTAPHIVGGFLADKTDRSLLYEFARSSNLWKKRIAILSTLYFISKQKQYADTFAISTIVLHDSHDLIHKAVGWMLREVGKRISEDCEETFLKQHYKTMPRTMLRYAIERFGEDKRKAYLNGTR